MEKFLVIIVCCVLLVVCLTACSKKNTGAETSQVTINETTSTDETLESTSNEASEITSNEVADVASSPEKVTYQVELTAIGDDKFSVIDTYRKLASLELKEARDIANTAPVVILETSDAETANQYKTELEAVGATVTISDGTSQPTAVESTESQVLETIESSAFSTDSAVASEIANSTGGIYAVDRVFSIKDAGTVFTGAIQEGTIKIGDSAVIILEDGTEIPATINRIEVFGALLEEAEAGQHVGIGFAEAIEKDSVLTAKSVVIAAE